MNMRGKAIEASDEAKKKRYEKKYRHHIIAFVKALQEAQKTCRGNARFAAALKKLR